jgi:hypothetical protein
MRYRRTGNSSMHWARRLRTTAPWRVIVALLLPVAVVGWAGCRPTLPVLGALNPLRTGGWGPVYSVAAVKQHLAQNPNGWSGRTVLVRARAIQERFWAPPDRLVTSIALVDPTATTSIGSLSLQWSQPDLLLAALRRLPLLGHLVPPPQRPHWDGLAVYRLQLCAPPGCVPSEADAVLLDATPGYP